MYLLLLLILWAWVLYLYHLTVQDLRAQIKYLDCRHEMDQQALAYYRQPLP